MCHTSLAFNYLWAWLDNVFDVLGHGLWAQSEGDVE